MAILNNLIVNGAARFLNKTYFDTISADKVDANEGIFKKLVAKDASLTNATIVGLLDVQGDMHTNSWSNSNIATIDGNFYITPTAVSADGADVTASGYTPTGTITYSSTNYTQMTITGTFDTSQLTLDGTSAIAWPANSYVIVTGDVLVGTEWYPLGTIRGKLSAQVAANTSSKTFTIIPIGTQIISGEVGNVSLTDGNGYKPSTLEAIRTAGATLTSLKLRKVKISMTSRGDGNDQYALGIYMTAMGGNKKTFLDIYGGNNKNSVDITSTIGSTTYQSGAFAKPTVRIGNLLGLPAVGGITPTGWGIYTTNGFFSGTVAATQGKIGSGTKIWTIGSVDTTNDKRSYIYSGVNSVSSTTTEGIYVGTDGILNVSSSGTVGRPYVQITNGVITAQGAIINGTLSAGAGSTIGPWTVSSNAIYNPSDKSSLNDADTINGVYLGKDGITLGKGVFKVTSAGALTATGATLKSLTIQDSSGNTVGTFASNIMLGREATDKYNILIDPTNGIQNRKNTTVLSQFDSSSIKFFDQSGTNDANVIAKFTNTSTTIGKTGQSRAFIDYHSMKMFDRNNNVYFEISDLRNENGSLTILEKTTTNYYLMGYTTNYNIDSITSISIDDTQLSSDAYSFNGSTIRFTPTLSDIEGSTLSITYISSDIHLKAYTLGLRLGNIGAMSFASGESAASGRFSHSEGYWTHAEGDYSHAEGSETQALLENSHAEGHSTTASGYHSHAEGSLTKAIGDSCHAEGNQVKAAGWCSHAEGNVTEATGWCSHAEGEESKASGFYSHAEGYWTVASGDYSHAQNRYTVAAIDSQTVIGKYNAATVTGSGDTATYTNVGDYAFIIGNGTANTTAGRSNALTVDWNGNVNIASGAKYKINGTNLAASDVGAVPTSRTVNGKALSSNVTLTTSDIGAVADCTLSLYNGAGGNPGVAKFCTVNYSTAGSESGVLFKTTFMAGHGNGMSYNHLQDAIISVGYTGAVSVDIYRYYAQSVTYSGTTHYYGDILYTIDTTNKIVTFYTLMGQYSTTKFSPYKRLNASTGGTITQHTGTAVMGVSGTPTFANVYWLNGTNLPYLSLSGGTMNGPISTNSNSLPQFSGAPAYLVGIEAFASGGTMKWQSIDSIRVGYANNLVLPGAITMYAGSTAPTGWLLCDGSAVSRTTYSELYAVIGTTYGSGNGSSTFNLPDLRGRAPIGAGTGSGLTARTLGTQNIGSENAIIPYHRHSVSAVSDGITGGSHNHNMRRTQSATATSGSNRYFASGSVESGFTTSSETHTHNLPAHNTNYAGTSGNTTGANMQPSAVVNFIICTGKTS